LGNITSGKKEEVWERRGECTICRKFLVRTKRKGGAGRSKRSVIKERRKKNTKVKHTQATEIGEKGGMGTKNGGRKGR